MNFTQVMSGIDERFEVVQSSKSWVDIAKIGDVVAEIFHWTLVNWGKPNGLNPELGEVGELGLDA